MYRRRGRQSEQQASIKKFLEHHKDPLRRLNLLKRGFGEHMLEKTTLVMLFISLKLQNDLL